MKRRLLRSGDRHVSGTPSAALLRGMFEERSLDGAPADMGSGILGKGRNRRSRFRVVCLVACVLAMLVGAAEGKETAQKPSGKTAAVSTSTSKELPWMILTGKLAFGAAPVNAMNLYWETETGRRVDVESMNNVFQTGFIPEAFFMPTKGRHFLLSASLPIGVGMGAMNPSGKLTEESRPVSGKGAKLDAGEEIFKGGERVFYNFMLINGGIGYQFPLGRRDATAIFLMSHFGGGPAWLKVECLGTTIKTGPMTAIDADASLGVHHRLKNKVVLGASLDGWIFFFRGDFDSHGPIDFPVDELMLGASLNLFAGYAFF